MNTTTEIKNHNETIVNKALIGRSASLRRENDGVKKQPATTDCMKKTIKNQTHPANDHSHKTCEVRIYPNPNPAPKFIEMEVKYVKHPPKVKTYLMKTTIIPREPKTNQVPTAAEVAGAVVPSRKAAVPKGQRYADVAPPQPAAPPPVAEPTPVKARVSTAKHTEPVRPKKMVFARTSSDSTEFAALPEEEQQELRKRLEVCKKTINNNMAAAMAIAKALTEIRDLRLYRVEGYSDFGKFCRDQLGMAKSTVTRQIAEGAIYDYLASTGAKYLPKSDRQLRELQSMRKPDQSPEIWGPMVLQVWDKAVKDAELNRTPITGKSVAAARKQLGFDPEPKHKKTPETDLDKRWLKVDALLRHEREFWPVEHHREFSIHIADLLAEWADSGKKSQPEFDAATSPVATSEPPPAVDDPVPEQDNAPNEEPEIEPERPRVRAYVVDSAPKKPMARSTSSSESGEGKP